jgi:hypothetical protein
MVCGPSRFGSVAVVLVTLALAAGCTSHGERTYHDPAGWTIEVPPGWHVVPFTLSNGGVAAAGAQVSNVELSPPTIVPGAPIQPNDLAMPADGIALIVTTDTDPHASQQATASPPLSLDEFTSGSAPAGGPTLQALWFVGDGHTFLATVKAGANTSAADRHAVADLIRSLGFPRFDGHVDYAATVVADCPLPRASYSAGLR